MYLNDYGCRVLSPAERMDIYELRRGKDEVQLERIARGIEAKRRILNRLHTVAPERNSAGTLAGVTVPNSEE